MPELPEVETIKRDLEKSIVGLRVEDVDIFDSRVLGHQKPAEFIRALKGQTIQSVSRRAKVLIIQFKNLEFLVVHLKMTGQLIYGDHFKNVHHLKETKIVFKLSNGFFLNYNDQRLFGRLYATKNLEEISFLKKLGPEPLDLKFTSEIFRELLKNKTTPIKVLLMKPEFVSGIGNIYASEILFNAQIDPRKKSGLISVSKIKVLHQSIVNILNEAIKYRGSSMRNYRDASGEKGQFIHRIKVYAKENQPCPKCRQPIERIIQAARSTFYCSQCQK